MADNLKGNILVVDDNPTNRNILTKQLASWGCNADAVTGGKDALSTMSTAYRHRAPYAAVLLDLQMPEMDGETVARTILNDNRIYQTAIAIMTSVVQPGDHQKFKDIGCAAYMTKPIKQSQLYNCLLEMMGQHSATQEGQERSFVTQNSVQCSDNSRHKILLAEDNAVNQLVAKNIVQKLGYQVDVVENGKEAVSALEQSRYDLLLLDVQMPEMDGFEVTSTIRNQKGSKPDNSNIPILAMTAHALQGDRERCLESGMDDYISKPIDADMLRQKMNELLKGTRKEI